MGTVLRRILSEPSANSESEKKPLTIMCKIVILTAAILAVLTGQTLAQAQAPLTCAQATSLDFNNTDFRGNWMEVVRNPSPNAQCINVRVELLNETTLGVQLSQSSSSSSLYMNVYETANITLEKDSTKGYNVTFTELDQPQQPTFIKLLSFVNYTYLIGCSYTDANNVSTSAGFILGRSNYTSGNLTQANNDAADGFTNFQKDQYYNVTQVGCFASSAVQNLPMISGFLALALLLIRSH